MINRNDKAPRWLEDLIKFGLAFLNVNKNWAVRTKVVPEVGGNPDTVANCSYTSIVWNCTLNFRGDVEDNFYWWQTAFHELLHICLVELSDCVESEIIRNVPVRQRDNCNDRFIKELEKYVDAQASVMANMYAFLREKNLIKEYAKREQQKAHCDDYDI